MAVHSDPRRVRSWLQVSTLALVLLFVSVTPSMAEPWVIRCAYIPAPNGGAPLDEGPAAPLLDLFTIILPVSRLTAQCGESCTVDQCGVVVTIR